MRSRLIKILDKNKTAKTREKIQKKGVINKFDRKKIL